jgi:hypothetical protein
LRRRWQVLSTQDRIAVISLLVALLAALPSYLALRASGGGRPDQAVAVPTSGVPESDTGQALQLLAKYNWTATHVIWALPGQLSSEDSQLAQQPFLGGPDQAAAIATLEALLARRGGVKIDFIDTPQGVKEDSELRLVITGQHSSPVLITRMEARVVKRQPPLSETLFFGPRRVRERTFRLRSILTLSARLLASSTTMEPSATVFRHKACDCWTWRAGRIRNQGVR